jgi:hypothetical protein
MNISMIKVLVMKDWQLHKTYIVGYILLGIIASLVMTLPSYAAYYIGQVLLVTVLIGSSAHLSISLVITEKKEYQLSFIMGLPINVMDYIVSKMIGGLFIYGVCWLAIVVSAVLIIDISALPDGHLPMAILCSLEILVATSLLLSIGILSGSEPITIISMVTLNLLFNAFLFFMASIPEIGGNIGGDIASFPPIVITIIGVEIALIIAVTLVTLGIKSRQACFL